MPITFVTTVRALPDYDAACRAAATGQGLDPLTDALTAAGIPHAVEQTGGFCMVVTVATGNLAEEPGTFTLTDGREGGGPEGTWLTGFWPGTTWQTGEYDEDSTDFVLTTEEVTVILTNQCRD